MYTVEQESGTLLSPTRILLCLVVLINGLITRNVAFLFCVTVWRRKKPKWLSVDLHIFYSIAVIIPGALDSTW